MANYYCDHGSYPAYSATPATAPSASAAQDGDGLGTGTSTVAYMTYDFTGVTAIATNTLTVCGALLTCVASGATANQFNAGSGSTLATNLASAINAATNTVTAAASGWRSPQLRNAVYATTSGAVLKIQTRCGSAVYNANASWQVTSATAFNGAAITTTQFANGASGAWGCLVNDDTLGAMWPSSMAKWTYSWMLTTRIAGPDPNAADICYLRANNNVVLHSTASTNANVYFAYEINLVVDDGTIWSGDTGYFRLREAVSSAGATMTIAPAANSTRLVWEGRNKSRFQILVDNAGTVLLSPVISYNGTAVVIRNATITDSGTGNGCRMWWNGANSVALCMYDCDWTISKNAFTSIVLLAGGGYDNAVVRLEGCTFNWTTYTGAPGALVTQQSDSGKNIVVHIRGCSATGISPFPFSTIAGQSVGTGRKYIAEDLQGFQVQTSIGMLGFYNLVTNNIGDDEFSSFALQQSVGATRQFRLDTNRAIVAWNSGLGFPYLDSYLPDGTPWSYGITWGGSTLSYLTRLSAYGIDLIKLTKTIVSNAGLSGAVSLEMLFDPTVAASLTDVFLSLSVSYVAASDSKLYVESTRSSLVTHITGAGSALSAGSGSWTKSTAAAGFTALKLSKTLSRTIQNNTEICLTLRAHKMNPTSGNTTFYVNPNIGVA